MKKVKCRNCYNYCNEWCELTLDDKYPDIERDCQYFREKTNADHIRSMTDEELAKILLNGNVSDVCPNGCDTCDGDCDKRMLDWLKQPYGGDT